MTTVKTHTNHPFGDRYANAVGALPDATEKWVDGLRQTSRAIIGARGLPSRKIEAWKYTSFHDLISTPFIPAMQADDVDVTIVPMTLPVLEEALKIVFVNGAFRADLSDPIDQAETGFTIRSLSHTFKQAASKLKSLLGAVAEPGKSVISDLNTSFMNDGLVLFVDAGVRLEAPIHVVSIGASGARPGSFHPRFEIKLGPSAHATVVESHIGLPGQSYLTNPVSEIAIGEAGLLNHYTLVGDDSDAFHLGRTAVRVDRAGRYESFILSMGGKLVRREIQVTLDQHGAEARVDGAYGIAGNQHSDIHSEIIHQAPRTVSHQTVKGILGGQSRGVFQGRIHVARTAQGSDGRQLHKALMLNRGPEVDCKPELEIFADDVQCAHGATTGELDKDHLFYLLSRGIDERTARALLIEGFLDDVVLRVSHESVQQMIMDTVKNWLARQTNLIREEQS